MIRAAGLRVRRASAGRMAAEVLHGVDVAVGPGGLTVVLGRSGAGKTTLLEALAGLLTVDGGKVDLKTSTGDWSWGAGRPAPPEVRRRVGLLFQFPERQLFGADAVEDVSWGLSGPDASGAAEDALARVELPEALWRAPIRRLSRGEKRRVALAGVLAREPDLLLLDEPGVGLDPAGQRVLWREVEAYRREKGAGVVVATHWPEAFLGQADQVLCLAAGQALYAGAPAGLLDSSAEDPELAGLLPFGLRLRAALRRGDPPAGLGAGWAEAAALWLAKQDAAGPGIGRETVG